MPCYSYSSNQPVYLEPNQAPFSIEVEYSSPSGTSFSYAGIARLCEIEAKDQLCVYTLIGATETLKILGTHYTVNTNPETITYTDTLAGVDKLIIRRCTPNNKMLISFAEGAKLSAKQLNLVTHQLLFIAQEKQFKDANITHVYPLAASVNAWSNSTPYVVGNYVTLSGVVYECISNHTNQTPPNATYWVAREFLTKGFVIQNASQPVVIDLNGIGDGQGLTWQTNKFVVGNPTVNVTLTNNSIGTEKLKSTGGEEAVSTNNIRSLAVTVDKVADGAITPAKLSTGKPTWTNVGVLTIAGLVNTGLSTLTGTVTCNGGINVSSGNLTVSSGNLSVSGTLNVSGATTVQNLTINGTLSGAGATPLFPSFEVVKLLTAGTIITTNQRSTSPAIPGLAASITPKKANGKIKITIMLNYEAGNDTVFILERSSAAAPTTWVDIAVPTSSGNRNYGIASAAYDAGNNDSTMSQLNIAWVDDITTVQQYNYRLRAYQAAASGTLAYNRTLVDADAVNNGYERVVSCIILQEIFV